MAAELGEQLRSARKGRKTTQAQLAKLLGVEQAMISMLEAGTTRAGPMLEGKIRAWIRGGEGAGAAPRGPYRT